MSLEAGLERGIFYIEYRILRDAPKKAGKLIQPPLASGGCMSFSTFLEPGAE